MTRFYVYHLVDPRDNSVFYVGKGQRTRGSDHVKDIVVHKKESDHPKDLKIRDIIGSGNDVGVEIVQRFILEADALEFERNEIARFGLENLTNIRSGYESTAATREKEYIDSRDQTAKAPNKGGRPSLYTDEIVEEIVSRLSEGEPLAQICRGEGMPSYSTVYAWQQTNPKVSEAIAHARELGEEVIASNTRNIARGLEGSTGDVQRDKLVIDTDLKLLAKWNPKKYGDKLHQEVSGKDGGAIIVEDRTPLETARRIAFILSHAAQTTE